MGQGTDAGDPRTTGVETLLAWSPWVAAGAGAGVLFDDGAGTVLGLELQPVTLLVGVAAVLTWLVCRWALDDDPALRTFATAGVVAFAPILAVTVDLASREAVLWLAVAFLGAVVLGVWAVGGIDSHGGSEEASHLGGFVVFGQGFDALTTAVGVDVLGYGEQTPLSRSILALTDGFPFTAITGTSWVFIAVKLALAVGVVVLFVDVGEESWGTGLVLGIAAFAGLGPAVHNVVLFALA